MDFYPIVAIPHGASGKLGMAMLFILLCLIPCILFSFGPGSLSHCPIVSFVLSGLFRALHYKGTTEPLKIGVKITAFHYDNNPFLLLGICIVNLESLIQDIAEAIKAPYEIDDLLL